MHIVTYIQRHHTCDEMRQRNARARLCNAPFLLRVLDQALLHPHPFDHAAEGQQQEREPLLTAQLAGEQKLKGGERSGRREILIGTQL